MREMSWQDNLLAFRKDPPSASEVARALGRPRLSERDLWCLLSVEADKFLDKMASLAQTTTRRHFGAARTLYAPLYISDACVNGCVYCGFRADARFARRTLELEEVERESTALAARGIREVLLLTGEAPHATPLPYLCRAVSQLRRHFASVGLEIFPCDEEGYGALRAAGADSLTLYQETFFRETYAEVHPWGPKRDYENRLEAPFRAAKQGFARINVGALLGLAAPREEAFLCALYARRLLRQHPGVEVGISFPRFRGAGTGFLPRHDVSDRLFSQILFAVRLFLPTASIVVSTREAPELRDWLAVHCATRLSVASSTRVGGYDSQNPGSQVQFERADERSSAEFIRALRIRNLDPVFKNWENP